MRLNRQVAAQQDRHLGHQLARQRVSGHQLPDIADYCRDGVLYQHR